MIKEMLKNFHFWYTKLFCPFLVYTGSIFVAPKMFQMKESEKKQNPKKPLTIW